VDIAALAQGLEAFCRRLQPTLDQLTFAQRRQLVELLIDHVIVTDGQVEIRYVVPTGPKGEITPFCHLRLDYLCQQTGDIIDAFTEKGQRSGHVVMSCLMSDRYTWCRLGIPTTEGAPLCIVLATTAAISTRSR
jgi:hypothetical protein